MFYGLMMAILPPQLMAFPATPIFVMIALILWLLPDIGGIYYRRLQQFMILFIAVNTAWPGYVAFNLPGLPWISLTRIVLFIVLVIFSWNFSTSREMRHQIRDSFSESPAVAKIFWLYWLTTLVSLAFSQYIVSSISKFVNNQIYWTMIFFVGTLLATRKGYVEKFTKTVVFATAVMLVFSIYEFHIQRVPWLGYLPSFLKIDPEILEILNSAQSRSGTDVYRVRGNFGGSLFYSEFLTMAFPFFLHFFIKERRLFPFMALGAGLVACMLVMYLTNARSAMLGILVTFCLYPLYAAIRRRSIYSRSIVATSVIMAYPMILALVATMVIAWPRAHVMILGGGQHQASSDARAEQWRMGVPKLLSHPLGYGVASGNEALGYFNPGGKGTVDSYYLTVMLDSGIIALPLFLLTFLLPAWLGFKYHRTATTPEQEILAPLSIAIINFIIVQSVLSSEANIPLALSFVSCIVGLIWQYHRVINNDAASVTPLQPNRTSAAQGKVAPPTRPAIPAFAKSTMP
jgi:hypothetical protein